MSHLLLSIVVTTYNNEVYISECIHSILKACTYLKNIGAFEILVYDDGSTDGTFQMLQFIEEQSPEANIKIRQYAHTGSPARARNQAIEEARGNYICYIDGDDYIKETLLKNVCAFMEQNQLSVAYSATEVFEERNHFRWVTGYPSHYNTEDGSRVFHHTQATEGFWRNMHNGACFKMYERSFLLKEGLRFLPIGAEDLFFSIESFVLADKIGYWDDPGYVYRRHKKYGQHLYQSNDFDLYISGFEGYHYLIPRLADKGKLASVGAEVFLKCYQYVNPAHWLSYAPPIPKRTEAMVTTYRNFARLLQPLATDLSNWRLLSAFEKKEFVAFLYYDFPFYVHHKMFQFQVRINQQANNLSINNDVAVPIDIEVAPLNVLVRHMYHRVKQTCFEQPFLRPFRKSPRLVKGLCLLLFLGGYMPFKIVRRMRYEKKSLGK